MMKVNKQIVGKILTISLWLGIGAGVTLLLIGAVAKERENVCKDLVIEFDKKAQFQMVEKNEVIYSLWPKAKNNYPVGKAISSIDLYGLEKQLEKNPWVSDADLYVDQLKKLHLKINQRNPVARIFTPDGNSFFIDKEFAVLPIKPGSSIPLPVFTNFPNNGRLWNANDTMLMKRIVALADFIQNDSLWMAQIEQVNINANGAFEVLTQMGDQSVNLGLRSDWGRLFLKLKKLYQKINEEGNWAKYSSIDLQYKDQVVCLKKGTNYKVIDSINKVDSTLVQIKTTQKNPVKNTL